MLSCRGVTKRFGRVTALNAVDLDIGAGGAIALVGPNGAGKTTFLSLVCGYIRPSGGSLTVFGHAPGRAALHGLLAALPQDADLIPGLSIGTQLDHFAQLQGLSRPAASEAVLSSLEAVRLRDRIKANPEELSHGMRKRASLAQALLGSPSLVLLDEPTAGLDPPNAAIVRDFIINRSQSATFIISSHNLLELEQLCDSVIVLDQGRLITHETIVASGSQHQYLTVQMSLNDGDALISACANIDGVLSVEIQRNSVVIMYDQNIAPTIDLQVLELIHRHRWGYRSIIRGRPLEEQFTQMLKAPQDR